MPIHNAASRARLLYIMHVDWRWIKQRPHFLAEELATRYEIRILHRAGVTRRRHLVDNPPPYALSPLLPLPWSWKYVRKASMAMQRRWVARMVPPPGPDIVWITHPSLLEAIPAELKGSQLIYDCMDDAFGFPGSESRRALIAALEHNLVMRASVIFCSSLQLCKLLVSRYGADIQLKNTLVRNGVSSSLSIDRGASALNEASHSPSRRFRLAYIGTVAEWIDFESVLQVLEALNNVEFHFIGPSIHRGPQHDRLHYHGPVPHAALVPLATRFDGFVMPFRLSPLTEAVDPVKLYEYLTFGREVLSVRYSEIERFSNFVHFYESPSGFLNLVRSLVTGNLELKNTTSGTSEFLAANTWNARGRQILRVLAGLEEAISA